MMRGRFSLPLSFTFSQRLHPGGNGAAKELLLPGLPGFRERFEHRGIMRIL